MSGRDAKQHARDLRQPVPCGTSAKNFPRCQGSANLGPLSCTCEVATFAELLAAAESRVAELTEALRVALEALDGEALEVLDGCGIDRSVAVAQCRRVLEGRPK